ncbi:MAG TPA: tRNA (cytidine(34)-2'-O)-methyltransferase [Bacilli bacterium]
MNHIVLYEPEIPQNTGNIMRTCVATNTILHLIEPLGFKLTEKEIKRSGANYIKDVEYYVYPNFQAFLDEHQNKGEFYYLSRYGLKTMYDIDAKDVNKDYYFVFGKESTGIPKEILKANIDRCIRLPMTDKVRALNLSNVCAIIVYEALRQQGFPNLSFYEPENFKGKNYLIK